MKDVNAVVNCACGRCNSGWMERLDKRAQPLVSPFARGEVGRLASVADTATVSAWAAKIGMCLASVVVEGGGCRDEAALLREQHVPPKGVSIWMGASLAQFPQMWSHQYQLSDRPMLAQGVEGYSSTFKIHGVVFQVAYLPEPIDPSRNPGEDSGTARRATLAPRLPPDRLPARGRKATQRDRLDRALEVVCDRTVRVAGGSCRPRSDVAPAVTRTRYADEVSRHRAVRQLETVSDGGRDETTLVEGEHVMPATLRHAHPEVADDRRDGDAQLGSDLVHRQTTPPVEVSGVSGESFRPYRARARNPCVRAHSPLTTCPSPSQTQGRARISQWGTIFCIGSPLVYAAFRALADSRRTRRSICRTVPSLSPVHLSDLA